MSVVLIGPSGSLGRAVLSRLMDQGDDIRVIEDDPTAADGWKAMGAHVAQAPEWDADLIERASFGARTLVVFEDARGAAVVAEAVRAAGPAGVDRIVLVVGQPQMPPELEFSELSYVVIARGRRSRLKRASVADDELVARAVDAADDLAGRPRLVVDLTDDSSLASLGLSR